MALSELLRRLPLRGLHLRGSCLPWVGSHKQARCRPLPAPDLLQTHTHRPRQPNNPRVERVSLNRRPWATWFLGQLLPTVPPRQQRRPVTDMPLRRHPRQLRAVNRLRSTQVWYHPPLLVGLRLRTRMLRLPPARHPRASTRHRPTARHLSNMGLRQLAPRHQATDQAMVLRRQPRLRLRLPQRRRHHLPSPNTHLVTGRISLRAHSS